VWVKLPPGLQAGQYIFVSSAHAECDSGYLYTLEQGEYPFTVINPHG